MEAPCCAQVFEYLTTDLNKVIYSTGRGPESPPMPIIQIKVSRQMCKHVKHCQNTILWCLTNTCANTQNVIQRL